MAAFLAKEPSSTKRTAPVGVVYFLQVGDDGPIKIGFTTKDLHERIRSMQTGSPYILRILGVLEKKDRHKEAKLHKRFRSCMIRSEWFQPSAELLKFIENNATEWVESMSVGKRRYVYLPKELADELEAIGKEQGRSLCAMARIACEDYLVYLRDGNVIEPFPS